MRRGLIISLFLHLSVFFFVWVNMKDVLFPKPEVTAIKIKLVTAKDVKKTTQPQQPKAVNTQQSAAPAAPPKPKPKPKPKPQPKPDRPTVVQQLDKKTPAEKQVTQKPDPKKPEPPKQEEPKVADVPRPPKLDKTKDKKNIIKDDNAPKTDKPAPDDFLQALSFIEELEAEESAMFEGEETTDPTTLNLADQREIAFLKKHIEKNWYKTPGTYGEQDVHYRLKLNRDGTLASMELIQSSGKRSFDRSLERAIRKSAPFPIAPDKYDLFKEIDLHWSS